jgi:hypothetical protein
MKYLLLASVFIVSGVFCLAEAGSRDLDDHLRPSLDLKAAIECAEKFAKDERIDLSKYFLYSVNLVTKPGMGRDFEWRVVWDQPQHATDDEIELAVQMDKKVTRLFRG